MKKSLQYKKYSNLLCLKGLLIKLHFSLTEAEQSCSSVALLNTNYIIKKKIPKLLKGPQK